MGNLFKPAVPSYAPVYIPPSAADSPSSDTNKTVAAPPELSGDDNDKAETAKDVVRRAARGRGSTVLTSFRGVLDGNNLAPQRKSLLGE